MGQTTSNVARKVTRSISSVFSSTSDDQAEPGVGRFAVTPYVFKRTGSMYFDEDGDLAHEFFIEVKRGHKYIMKRSYENLTPQGEVELSHPRFNVDFPTVLCRAPYS
ncbi:tumor suppressor candidate 2-like [Ruditapes philippinarum]|uniref:tumor suppressor candidate 2-like n=1 Tax=Ruditapes philippinarum TaxID=129788 RepID=UPI00295C0C26|nr:tumor suppressor candidate 2-like [Ruditapes philippinarum]